VPERHFTDEEIAATSGGSPVKVAPATPRATCLKCGNEHEAWYATSACDCRFPLITDGRPVRRSYLEHLRLLQDLGFGVLRDPVDAKFTPDKQISARQALTMHLQSDLFLGAKYTLDANWYCKGDFEGWIP
jgi:hypothetical protein